MYCMYAVSLFIERQQAAKRFAEGCILLSLRPLRIGKKNVSQHFCKFKPQSEYVMLFSVNLKHKRVSW